MASPFSLAYGSSVYAKLLATNVVGSSGYSAAGNGAIILSTPGAPTSLVNNVAVSTATSLLMTWVAPVLTGGSPVIDYRVYYD